MEQQRHHPQQGDLARAGEWREEVEEEAKGA